MNIIILYQTNEHIFPDFYWIASTRDIPHDQNRWGNRCPKYYLAYISTAIIGVYYARIQGIQTLRSGLINLYQNRLRFTS